MTENVLFSSSFYYYPAPPRLVEAPRSACAADLLTSTALSTADERPLERDLARYGIRLERARCGDASDPSTEDCS